MITDETHPVPEALRDPLQQATDACFIMSTLVQGGTGLDPLIGIGGGFIRDRALGFEPKDMDVFLPHNGYSVNELGSIALAAGTAFYKNPRVAKLMKSYGSWAADVHVVHKITGEKRMPLLPDEMDFVSIRCPNHELGLTDSSFLDYVLGRVDIRLNAVGATKSRVAWHPLWERDAALKRLVMQRSRMGQDGDESRSKARMRKRLADKFQGWTAWAESEWSDEIYQLGGNGWTV